jgi:hypothetical protein
MLHKVFEVFVGSCLNGNELFGSTEEYSHLLFQRFLAWQEELETSA